MKYSVFIQSVNYISNLNEQIHDRSLYLDILLLGSRPNDVMVLNLYDNNTKFIEDINQLQSFRESINYSSTLNLFYNCDMQFNCETQQNDLLDLSIKLNPKTYIFYRTNNQSLDVFILNNISIDDRLNTNLVNEKNVHNLDFFNEFNRDSLELIKTSKTPQISVYNIFNFYNNNYKQKLHSELVNRVEIEATLRRILQLAYQTKLIISCYEDVDYFTEINNRLNSKIELNELTLNTDNKNKTYSKRSETQGMFIVYPPHLAMSKDRYLESRNFFYHQFNTKLIDPNYLNFYFHNAQKNIEDKVINKEFEFDSIDETIRLLLQISRDFVLSGDIICLDPVTLELKPLLVY